MKELYSVFEHENIKGIKSLEFYKGDCTNKFDLTTDWRFKAIENTRKQSRFLGLIETEFPIVWHFHTNKETIYSNNLGVKK